MNDLVTSRRSFLKLFGATAAIVALPLQTEALVSVAPIPVSPVLELRPGVLHVLDQVRGWCALGGIRDFTLNAPETVTHWHRTIKGSVRDLTTVVGPPKIETHLFESDLDRLLPLQYEQARFAISMPRFSLEFDGVIARASFEGGLYSEWVEPAADLTIEQVGKGLWRSIPEGVVFLPR